MVRILALAAVVAWALACSPAHAATVWSAWSPGGPSAVYVDGAPGEANHVTVVLAGEHLVLRDTAGVRSSPTCLPVDAHTAHCPLGSDRLQVSVNLGDGDDTFDMPRSTAQVTVLGGEGNDVVTVEGDVSQGGELARLEGGPGDDRLYGEWVSGGPGNDVLKGDVKVDFSDNTAGVDIDLESGRATSADGVDQIVPTSWKRWTVRIVGGSGPDRVRAAPGRDLSVEAGAGDDVLAGGAGNDSLAGGAGNDVIRGAGGRNGLDGGEGDDRLQGSSGKDALNGGDGDDVLDGRGGLDSYNGGDGADEIRARDGRPELVDCSGRRMAEGDRVIADADDVVQACTDIRRPGVRRLEVQAVVESSRDRQTLLVWCPAAARPRACAGRIKLGRGRDAVTRAVRAAPGRTARVRFPVQRNAEYGFRATLRTGDELTGIVHGVEA